MALFITMSYFISWIRFIILEFQELRAAHSLPDEPGQFQPWKEEGSFCWDTYIEFSNAKSAPSKLFKCPFPTEDNPFKVGMRLEAIDPEHPALICVVSVAETVGKNVFKETFLFPLREVTLTYSSVDRVQLLPIMVTDKPVLSPVVFI